MAPIDHRDIDTEPPSLKKVVSSQHHINGTNLYRDTLKSEIEISERSVSPDDTIVSPDAAEKAPIAIVGMGMRLPGGIRTDKDLWDFLVNKQDANGLVPAERFNMDAFYSEQHHPGTAKARNGYYLGEDLAVFDAEFFGISSAELPRMDPRQRLLLEVVWECMESSGQVDWRGKNIGCFVGAFNEDWMELNHRDAQNLGMGSVNSVADFSVPNRISYQYDLTGPSMCVKTACSSSLVALHLAIQALRNGDCESAIVAGTNLIQSPIWTVAISEEGALSPDGNCKTFDASANGYARAEGINAIYIKKLDDALRAKDPIRSIIRGTSVSSDGRTIGFSTPSAASQERLIRATYRQAGIADISETPYVECHGTGTAVGDPTEVQAICDALGTNGTIIGAIKPNLGHAEAASGLSSLLKAVLALEHRQIPPNIKFHNPNPKSMSLSYASRLQVPTEVLPWPANRKERASVNGFGIGGVNAHAILETATSYTQQELPEQTDDESPHLLVISANTMNALRDRLDLLQTYLQNTTHSITDIAYTLGERREHLKFRAYHVMEGKKTLKASDGTKVATEVPKLVFVFTGQGAQWAGMGAELMKSSPQFRASVELMDQALATLPHPPAWTIQEQITSSTSNIDEAEFSQPLTTAFQVGILSTLQAWGVRPDVVVGHSSGEIAAAYAAGSLTIEQAIIAAYYRGVVAKESTRDGCMAALGMGKEAFLPYATAGVTVACENSPESITISGDTQQVENTLARIREAEPGVFCRRLRVKIAYHSAHMADVGQLYENLISPHLVASTPDIPFYSTVAGRLLEDMEKPDANYWRRNLESPVLFNTTVQSLVKDIEGPSCCVEIGPHSALAGPLRQIFAEAAGESKDKPTYVPSWVRKQPAGLTALAGHLYALGLKLDFGLINGPGRVLTDLPSYPWQYKTKYWEESFLVRDWKQQKYVHHELLGTRLAGTSDLEPSWRNLLRLDEVPWIQDHKVGNNVVFPCTGYLATAGEAIRQLTGSDPGYKIRDFVIRGPLILSQSVPTDLLTTLKPVRIMDKVDSATWYDFTISSYNGTTWTKHCTGKIRADDGHDMRIIEEEKEYSRKIPLASLYRPQPGHAVNLTGVFHTLEDVSVQPFDHVAAATLFRSPSLDHSKYSVHPADMDQVLQLSGLAAFGGIFGHEMDNYVPDSIEEITVTPGSSLMFLEARGAREADTAVICKDAIIMAGDRACVNVRGAVFRSMGSTTNTGDEDKNDFENLGALNLRWQPHIDLVPMESLLQPTDHRDWLAMAEKLTVLSILESCEQVRDFVSSAKQGDNARPHHLVRYGEWLAKTGDEILNGRHPIVPKGSPWIATDPEARSHLIGELSEHLSSTPGRSLASAVNVVRSHTAGILSGQEEALALLTQDNVWVDLHKEIQNLISMEKFFATYGHSRPTLRVLELGAGRGNLTSVILNSLVTDSGAGVRLYSEYMLTDVSPESIADVRERFSQFEGVQSQVLDISKDPVAQGFTAESYDLIIASNVLHATPSLTESLRNVRKLLVPGGRLVLQELASDMQFSSYVMGPMSTWWVGETDNRPWSPCVSPEEWDKRLLESGFDGIEAVRYDDEAPYHVNAFIVASASDPALQEQQPPKAVTLLYDGPVQHRARDIADHLVRQGYVVNWCQLGQDAQDEIVISLLDLHGPFLETCTPDQWTALQNHLTANRVMRTLWLTKHSQVKCADPRYGLIQGFGRTLRSEVGVDLATLEVDDFDATMFDGLVQVLKKLQARISHPDEEVDYEYALINGAVHTARFYPGSVEQFLTPAPESAVQQVVLGQYGDLDSFRWVTKSLEPLTAGQVRVRMDIAGLNFKDALIALGMVAGPKDGLGLDAAGVVTELSPEAAAIGRLRVGDRVMFAADGCIITQIAVDEEICVHIPDNMSSAEAATIPTVYGTAIYAIHNLGRLKKHQSILIHSACGGFGLAALQLAQANGAEIFATVGTETKKQYLIEHYGIDASHIFNSRNASFHAELMKVTNGRGADLVLNSLSGELLQATWKCVAKYGMMVEIGRRDMVSNAALSMKEFLGNRTFVGLDLFDMTQENPKVLRDLLEDFLSLYSAGKVRPITPLQIFPASQASDAFQYLQTGQHIGKVVLEIPQDSVLSSPSSAAATVEFRPDASYFLPGGLGGFGRSITKWMADRGARYFTYLSRSAGKSEEDQAFLEELEAHGCSGLAVQGSIDNLADIQRAIDLSPRPIAGVMNLAMLLHSMAFPRMTHSDWKVSLVSKVQGNWNLHRALSGSSANDLDFFLLFSSISSVLGNPGQANYSAGNSFVDSFARYRRTLGLPASVVNIGVTDEIGYMAEHPDIFDKITGAGMPSKGERDMLNAVRFSLHAQLARLDPASKEGYAVASAPVQLSIGMSSPEKGVYRPNTRDVRLDVVARVGGSAQSSSAGSSSSENRLSAFVSGLRVNASVLEQEETQKLLIEEIGAMVCSMLSMSEDDLVITRSLSSLGLDSLVNIKIRKWFTVNLGIEISVLEITALGSVLTLANMAIDSLKEKYGKKGE
ncbi:hypothetical protein ASPBRDRAFT_120577 [Aspergillus brasiliensis CBS 101740]|uniref:Uncharacterized protein n=1 Tax=Aspergillus brasiliensis (strain CBS 101740 / IMI 381727 / IBT 21946) TaxID=767769 RepID=A0A1L9US86_ASPBC|nr:hypothetical protein ASPBRDRAFT_120577 [Aspergillus brasiliensis CBS 101740]